MRRIKVATAVAGVVAAASFGFGITHAMPAAACTGSELLCVDPDIDFPSLGFSGCLVTVLGVCEVPGVTVCMNEHEGTGIVVNATFLPSPEDPAPFCTIASV